jgi:hypothetical protein
MHGADREVTAIYAGVDLVPRERRGNAGELARADAVRRRERLAPDVL